MSKKPLPAAGGRYTALRVIQDDDVGYYDGLPRGGRAECINGPRPCLYVHCNHNTWMKTGRDRAGRRHNGQMPPSIIERRRGNNCTLDYTTSGKEMSATEIGAVFGWTARRVQQEIAGIARKMMAAGDVAAVRNALELLGLDEVQAKKAQAELERASLEDE